MSKFMEPLTPERNGRAAKGTGDRKIYGGQNGVSSQLKGDRKKGGRGGTSFFRNGGGDLRPITEKKRKRGAKRIGKFQRSVVVSREQ